MTWHAFWTIWAMIGASVILGCLLGIVLVETVKQFKKGGKG